MQLKCVTSPSIERRNVKRNIQLPSRSKEYQRELRKARRKEILDLLGGECIQCTFSDPRALQIDHVNGGGHRERLYFGQNPVKLFKSVKENPDNYQLLCANCNQIKKIANMEF